MRNNILVTLLSTPKYWQLATATESYFSFLFADVSVRICTSATPGSPRTQMFFITRTNSALQPSLTLTPLTSLPIQNSQWRQETSLTSTGRRSIEVPGTASWPAFLLTVPIISLPFLSGYTAVSRKMVFGSILARSSITTRIYLKNPQLNPHTTFWLTLWRR